MLDFTVTPDSGDPYQVSAGTRDILRWERAVKGASFKSLMDNLRMVDLYHVAWLASTRQGLYAGTLAEFEVSADLAIEDQDDDEPDPTHPAP